jgi:hypothetical protein
MFVGGGGKSESPKVRKSVKQSGRRSVNLKFFTTSLQQREGWRSVNRESAPLCINADAFRVINNITGIYIVLYK